MAWQGDQKDQVQQATDIVQLISEDLALHPKGREYVVLCPFHDDSKPSMTVSPQKQLYKCFACGEGGDVFGWMMRYRKMSFGEALQALAERVGIELKSDGQSDKDRSERQLILGANEKAQGFYRETLQSTAAGKLARDYLAKRGISSEMQQAFMLGYAPDAWDTLASKAGQRSWSQQGLELAGLISQRQQGEGMYDRLRHRLIFPIHNVQGRTIAFGGRKLREEDEPKYLNSPETPLFNKSATLYGLYQARKAMLETREAVIVEGYTDVIACHQAGICNVVATLGTALTEQHLRELRRFAQRVVLVFDGDEAGQRAADRGVSLFFNSRMDVGVAVLPGGVDPADLLATQDGVMQWKQAIQNASDAMDFMFERFRTAIEQAKGISAREVLADEFLAKLASLGAEQMTPIRRGQVVQRLSRLLHIGEPQINELLQAQQDKVRATQRRRAMVSQQREHEQVSTTPHDLEEVVPTQKAENSAQPLAKMQDETKLRRLAKAEMHLIGCLMLHPALFTQPLADGRQLDESITPGDMQTAIGFRLYQRMYEALSEQNDYTLQQLLSSLASENLHELASKATDAVMQIEEIIQNDEEIRKQVLQDAVNVIQSARAQQQYEQEKKQWSQLSNTQDDAVLRARELIQQLKQNHPVGNVGRIARNRRPQA